jgi:excisionase family DNA binding protein
MALKVDCLVPLGLKSSDMALLNLFLTLDKTERRKHFACTLRASEMVGVSRRTIQLWIEMGQIQAVRVSKKYQIHLPSLQEYLKNSMTA